MRAFGFPRAFLGRRICENDLIYKIVNLLSCIERIRYHHVDIVPVGFASRYFSTVIDAILYCALMR